MTRRLAVVTGVIFAVTAVLAAYAASPVLEILALGFSVLSFATFMLLKDYGVH